MLCEKIHKAETIEKLSKPVDGLVNTLEIICATIRYKEAGKTFCKLKRI